MKSNSKEKTKNRTRLKKYLWCLKWKPWPKPGFCKIQNAKQIRIQKWTSEKVKSKRGNEVYLVEDEEDLKSEREFGIANQRERERGV